MWVFHADGQFKFQRQFGTAGAHCTDRIQGEAGPVFQRAAVPVIPLIKQWAEKAAAHPVAVDLHHVKAGLLQSGCAFSKALCDETNPICRHLGDKRPDTAVYKTAHLIHGDEASFQIRYEAGHGRRVCVRHMELGTGSRPVAVNLFCQLLVKEKNI